VPLTDSSTMPLASVLAGHSEQVGLEAMVRFVGVGRYVWSRLVLHVPFTLPAVVGFVLIVVRNSSGNRLVPLVIAAVVGVVTFVSAHVISPKPSFGSRLCLISLPVRAVSLLGLSGKYVSSDAGGRVPRYRLLTTEQGVSIGSPLRGGGVLEDLLALRAIGAGVELEATRHGRLATCTLSRGGERVNVAVRGRLRLA